MIDNQRNTMPKRTKRTKRTKNFEIHLVLGGNRDIPTSPQWYKSLRKDKIFVFLYFLSFCLQKTASAGRTMAGQDDGRKSREGKDGERASRSERAKNGEIVPQNFRQRKSFLPDAVIRNNFLQKMLYLRPMVRDGQQERSSSAAEERRQLQRTSASRPAQATAKAHQRSAADKRSRAGRKMAEKPLFNPCGIKKRPINKGFSHGAVEWR